MNKIISMILIVVLLGTNTAYEGTVLGEDDEYKIDSNIIDKMYDIFDSNISTNDIEKQINNMQGLNNVATVKYIEDELVGVGFECGELFTDDCLYIKSEPIPELKLWDKDTDLNDNSIRPYTSTFAEIRGNKKPSERVILIGNTDSSASGILLDMAIKLKTMIDDGIVERPDRTILFIFGEHYASSLMWRDLHPMEMQEVVGVIDVETSTDKNGTTEFLTIQHTPNSYIYTGVYTDDVNCSETNQHSYKYYRGFYLNTLIDNVIASTINNEDDYKIRYDNYSGGVESDVFTWHSLNFVDEREEGYAPLYFPIPAITVKYNEENSTSIDDIKNLSLISLATAYYAADMEKMMQNL